MADDLPTVKKKLDRFAAIRNQSAFSSNLQFQSDLEEAGLRIDDIGRAYKIPGVPGYQWFIPDDDRPKLRMTEIEGRVEVEEVAQTLGESASDLASALLTKGL